MSVDFKPRPDYTSNVNRPRAIAALVAGTVAVLAGSACARAGYDGYAAGDSASSSAGDGAVGTGGTSGGGSGGSGASGGSSGLSTASLLDVVFLSNDGDYITGQTLTIEATFSESVTVTAEMLVNVQIGFDTRPMTVDTPGTATSFALSYLVQAGDLDLNGVELLSPLDAAEATIEDGAGLTVVDLDFPVPASDGITVNAAGYTLSAGTAAHNTTTCLISEEQKLIVGAHEYRPSLLTDTPDPIAVVFFLHGAGENGGGGVYDGPLLVSTGLPQDVDNGMEIPLFVFSPQVNFNWNGGQRAIRSYIECVLDENPRADRDRVYLTGLSNGAMATWSFASENFDLIAAGAPIAGFSESAYPLDYDLMRYTPIWAFHGDADTVVHIDNGCCGASPSGRGTRSIINDWLAHPVQAVPLPKYTEFPGADHGIWGGIYDGSSLSGESPASLYTWLLQHERDVSLLAPMALPLAEATPTQFEVNRSQGLIDRMPSGQLRTDLQLRLDVVQTAVIAEVEMVVAAAEASADRLDLFRASRLNDRLNPGPTRDAFDARLAAIVVTSPTRVLIDVQRWGPPAYPPWTSTDAADPSVDATDVTRGTGFPDDTGAATTVGARVTSGFSELSGGATTDRDVGLIPDMVLTGGYNVRDAETAILTITGLTPAANYNIVLLASLGTSGDAGTTFTVGGSSLTIDAIGNLDTFSRFDGVAASGAGEIDIQVETDDDVGTGHLTLVMVEGPI